MEENDDILFVRSFYDGRMIGSKLNDKFNDKTIVCQNHLQYVSPSPLPLPLPKNTKSTVFCFQKDLIYNVFLHKTHAHQYFVPKCTSSKVLHKKTYMIKNSILSPKVAAPHLHNHPHPPLRSRFHVGGSPRCRHHRTPAEFCINSNCHVLPKDRI